jgi:hypothetical protein
VIRDAAELLGLFDDPPRAGARAAAVRDAEFGHRIVVCGAPERAASADWPDPGSIAEGERVVLEVEPDAAARARFAAWLIAAAARDVSWSLAPCSRASAGLHRLWCIAAARLALPARVRIEARHDLIGIRLAQIALGFGADTLAGPIQPDRSLPLAGVTRPDEATAAGLATLVREAALEPQS